MLRMEVVLYHPQFRKEMMFPYFYNLRKIMYILGGYSRSKLQWDTCCSFWKHHSNPEKGKGEKSREGGKGL